MNLLIEVDRLMERSDVTHKRSVSNRFKNQNVDLILRWEWVRECLPAGMFVSSCRSFYFATSLCGAVLSVLRYSQNVLSRCCCFSVALLTKKLCVQMLYLRLKTTCWLFPSTTHRPSWSNQAQARARSGFKLQGDVMFAKMGVLCKWSEVGVWNLDNFSCHKLFLSQSIRRNYCLLTLGTYEYNAAYLLLTLLIYSWLLQPNQYIIIVQIVNITSSLVVN